MKKSFFHIGLFLAVVGFVLITITFSTPTNAQTVPCTANWWARCCKCDKGCIVVDPLPSFGYCRSCTLLCSECRKELGDLIKAFEDLKLKNRLIYARYQAYQKNSVDYNEKMREAMVRTYGQESGGWRHPSTWNLNGFNSSFGKFTVAANGLLSNFGGGFGYTMLFDGLSTLQSSNLYELEGNISSTILDILTEEGIIEFYTMDANLNKSAWKLYDAFRKGQPMRQAVNLYNQDVKKLTGGNWQKWGNKVNLVADVIGLAQAGNELISDLTDILQNYIDRENSEKEREKLQEEIIKNADLLRCIKETQDSIKTGPLGINRDHKSNPFYATKLLVGFILADMAINTRGYRKTSQPYSDTYFWQIDTIKIKLAISQLKQQDALLKIMSNNFIEEVLPPMVPWILNKAQELKPATRYQLLQMLKSALNKLLNNYKSVKSLTESINENVTNAILGYETYFSDGSPGIITSAGNENGKKWEISANEKIKGEMGRVNMSFPAGVDWSVEFYTPENKYITSRSSFSKHQVFHDLPEGNYNIKLNHVMIENVAVEKGKEVKMKTGILSLVTRNHWELYNESKEKLYTTGIKPVKFALPVGNYVLEFEGKDHRFTVNEKVTVKFRSPVDDLFEK